jgi:nickel superoxide dismutase
MKLKSIIILSSIASTLFIAQVFGHCQVPCGVYTDQLRFEQMLEDQKTIEKASKLIHELSKKTDAQSHNQLSRWVATKESHASNIQQIVAEYFLIQRIKSSAPHYEKLLVAAHEVLVSAMKTKQSVDTDVAKSLKEAILKLHKEYERKK